MKMVILLVLLAGCASARQTYLPDGQVGYTLDCSGQARNWNMCLEKAGELCASRGYSIVWSNAEQGNLLTATQYGVVAGSTHSRNMVVRCR